MERSPERDYIEVNRQTLLSMLEAGEEVGLFIAPTATVAIQGEDELAATYEGRPAQEYDPQTLDGIDARHFTRMAGDTALSFRTRLHMALISHMFEDMVDGVVANPNHRTDDETAAYVDACTQGLQATVDALLVSSERTELIDNQTNIRYTIAATRAVDPDGVVLGRELEIDTQDGVIQKMARVSQFDTGAKARLEVKQSLHPASDEATRQMSEFFIGRHDDREGFSTMMAVFGEGLVQLIGPAAPENQEHTRRLQEMYARYASETDRQQLDGFMRAMQRKVEDFKQQHEMNRAFPGVDLPTFDELQEYAQLLNDIRS